jgi:membrane-associated PAP2 superfamily phosphatase
MEVSRISIKKINLLILVNIIFGVIALCWINYSDIDLELQRGLFNPQNQSWLIDRNEPTLKFIFYKFPKICLGIFIVVTLVATVLGFRKRVLNKSSDLMLAHEATSFFKGGLLSDDQPPLKKEVALRETQGRRIYQFLRKYRHNILLTLLGLSLIPLIAGNVKKFTNIYCPSQLEIYNGNYPYVKIFENYPADFIQTKKGKCFPAGHAITGFSLLILFFSLTKKSHKIGGLILGILLGWILGTYQMFKGAHFFGDTLIAMFLCFLLAALITRVYEGFLAIKH